LYPEGICWGTRPAPIEPGVYDARTITPDDKFDHVPVRVMNAQQQAHHIKAGTFVSELEVLIWSKEVEKKMWNGQRIQRPF